MSENTNAGGGETTAKIGGGYGGPVKILTQFQMSDGQERFVVGFKPEGGYGECAHIFSRAQLSGVDAALSAQSTGSAGVAAEPVAWAYEWDGDSAHTCVSRERPSSVSAVNIRPLYEHPPGAAEPVAGWKLVPVEPDRAMVSAGAVGSGEDSENVARGAYEAMLAAAPTPPAGGGETIIAAAMARAREIAPWVLNDPIPVTDPAKAIVNLALEARDGRMGERLWAERCGVDLVGAPGEPSPASPAGDLNSLSAGATADEVANAVMQLDWAKPSKGLLWRDYEDTVKQRFRDVEAAVALLTPADRGETQAVLHGRAWVAAEYRVTGSPHEWTDEDALAMARFILAGPPPSPDQNRGEPDQGGEAR